MKKQISALLISFVMIAALSGCRSEVMKTAKIAQIPDISFSESNEKTTSSMASTEESSTVGFEFLNSSTDAEESDTSITASAASEPERSVPSAPVPTQKPTAPMNNTQEEKPVSAPEQTKEQTPKPAEKPTEAPTLPPQTPTPEPEPAFDINYWICYSKSYAEGQGLNLDSTATQCWDNPISANAKCTCLERDIQSRMNRYARDNEITAVWIWAESTGDNSYDLYIGYA